MPSKTEKQRKLMAIAEHNLRCGVILNSLYVFAKKRCEECGINFETKTNPSAVSKKNRGVLKMSHEQLHDFASSVKAKTGKTLADAKKR